MDLPLADFHNREKNPLKTRISTISNLKNVYSYLKFDRNGVAQKILHQIKYNEDQSLGIKMGEWFGSSIKAHLELEGIDIIVPIPLHRSKLKRRGFNQSELIAKGLGNSLNISVRADLLERVVDTRTQTELSKTQRWINVDDIFKLKEGYEVENKHLMLVDDVITTGATIEAAANALTNSRCKSISLACIATGQK